MVVWPTYNSLIQFESVTRLVLISNLPIVSESLASSSNASGIPVSYNVLTSFVLPPDNTSRDVAFLPSDATNKWHELTTPTPLTNIFLQVFFELPSLGLFPLQLPVTGLWR